MPGQSAMHLLLTNTSRARHYLPCVLIPGAAFGVRALPYPFAGATAGLGFVYPNRIGLRRFAQRLRITPTFEQLRLLHHRFAQVRVLDVSEATDVLRHRGDCNR